MTEAVCSCCKKDKCNFLTRCKHSFHKSCLLKRKQYRFNCPDCRSRISHCETFEKWHARGIYYLDGFTIENIMEICMNLFYDNRAPFKHVFDKLFQLGYDINSPYKVKWQSLSLFQHSVKLNRLDIAEYLLKKGAKLDDATNLAFMAVRAENIEFLNVLKENGLDLSIKNSLDKTILHDALLFCKPEFFKRLLQEFVFDLNKIQRECQDSLLVSALNRKQFDVVELLVTKGFPIDGTNSKGETSLQQAVSDRMLPDTVEYLLKSGADPNVSDQAGNSVLMKLIENCYGNESVILGLLPIFKNYNTNFEHVNTKGLRPIHLVCQFGLVQVFNFLHEEKVDMRAVTLGNRIPYDFALVNGNSQIKSKLEELGCKFNEKEQLEFEGKLCVSCKSGNCDLKVRCGHFYHINCISGNCAQCGRTISSNVTNEKLYSLKKIPVEMIENKSLAELEGHVIDCCKDQKIHFVPIVNKIFGYLWRADFLDDDYDFDFDFRPRLNNNFNSNNGSNCLRRLLFFACQYNHEKLLRALLKIDKEVGCGYNDPDISHGMTPLHISCVHNNVTLTKLIMQSDDGSIYSLTKGIELTALHVACLFGNLATIKYLLFKDAPLEMETQRYDRHSLVLFCFQYAKLDVIELIGKTKKNLNVMDSNCATALHFVAMNPDKRVFDFFVPFGLVCVPRTRQDQIEIVKFLLQGGKSSVSYDRSFNTILSVALINRNMELFHYVLNNHVENINDHFLLHAIIRYDCLDLLDFVLNLNVDINAQTPKGTTALMMACHKGYYEIVVKLLELRADVNLKDSKGRTAIHFVSLNSGINTDDYDFELDCDIFHKTDFSWSRGYYHTKKSPELIKKLVEAGVDISSKDGNGQNALRYALRYNRPLDFIKELISSGISVEEKDNNGNDAFYYADYKICRQRDVSEYFLSLKNQN